ncbi:hypothetical protein D3C78_1604470 [compost metagenome]
MLRRYIPVILIDQNATQVLDMLRLAAEQTNLADFLFQFFQWDGDVVFRSFIFLKQIRCYFVHRRICALRRQQDRNSQLKGIAMVKLTVCIRKHRSNRIQNMTNSSSIHTPTPHFLISNTTSFH